MVRSSIGKFSALLISYQSVTLKRRRREEIKRRTPKRSLIATQDKTPKAKNKSWSSLHPSFSKGLPNLIRHEESFKSNQLARTA
jgi:hypothetical protein